jgi:hypothetical protein
MERSAVDVWSGVPMSKASSSSGSWLTSTVTIRSASFSGSPNGARSRGTAVTGFSGSQPVRMDLLPA